MYGDNIIFDVQQLIKYKSIEDCYINNEDFLCLDFGNQYIEILINEDNVSIIKKEGS